MRKCLAVIAVFLACPSCSPFVDRSECPVLVSAVWWIRADTTSINATLTNTGATDVAGIDVVVPIEYLNDSSGAWTPDAVDLALDRTLRPGESFEMGWSIERTEEIRLVDGEPAYITRVVYANGSEDRYQ